MQEPYLLAGKPKDLFKGPKDIHSAQMKPQDLSKWPPGLVPNLHNQLG